ncbi:hypothetical protein LH935_06965 [Gordonia polyisoprenivorans]|uniref:hypothetical protein n=1 Tax=Gordonia polyisoprenivorans TaxID=84595 RepID=UPI002234179B|nr:hypothetical protein LH935_06965 [Gordonia polyisoprenivorans]
MGLIVFLAIFHLTAYLRGWLVPGRHHAEVVADKKAEIERLEVANTAAADTIRIQATTINEKNAVEAVTEHLMQSVRELAERRGSQ